MAPSAAAVNLTPSHSISNLVYRLFAGPIELAPFTILDTAVYMWQGYRVTFHVLGASHAVVFERDRDILAETLTCGPLRTPAEVVAEAGVLCETGISAKAGGLSVHTQFSPFQLYNGWQAPAQFCTLQSLRVEFPHELSDPAETAVCWRIVGHKLMVETIHTYPEEQLGVRTHSTFEAANAPS